eukprot:3410901-Prymnesium_polylepis.1
MMRRPSPLRTASLGRRCRRRSTQPSAGSRLVVQSRDSQRGMPCQPRCGSDARHRSAPSRSRNHGPQYTHGSCPHCRKRAHNQRSSEAERSGLLGRLLAHACIQCSSFESNGLNRSRGPPVNGGHAHDHLVDETDVINILCGRGTAPHASCIPRTVHAVGPSCDDAVCGREGLPAAHHVP